MATQNWKHSVPGRYDPSLQGFYCLICQCLMTYVHNPGPELADSVRERKCSDCRRFVGDSARSMARFWKELDS